MGLVLGALLCAAIPAVSQVTGAPVLRGIYDQLSHQTFYKVEMNGDAVVLRDRSTGAEVVSVRENNPQEVTVSGVVGNLGDVSDDFRQTAMSRMALFNFSSPVGTLMFDQGSGSVVMYHFLNPRYVPVSSMARIALLCGDVASTRARAIFRQ